MQFFDARGVAQKGRRQVSGQSQLLGRSDVESNPQRLVDVINALSKRVSELEARIPPEAIEFELDVTATNTYVVVHGFPGSVRWYPTHWSQGVGVAEFVQVPNPTTGQLSLYSASTGKAVIRVEPSQFGVEVK